MNKKTTYIILLIVCVGVACILVFQLFSSKEPEGIIHESNEPEVVEEPRFSRPEERGEDFSQLETTEVVKIITKSTDKIEKRKAAKVIGDRNIADTLSMTDKEKEAIDNLTEGYLQQSKSKDSNERTEAKQQIERLWHVSVPVLLKNIGNPDPTIAELAAKSLILMRDENIISEVITIAETTQDVVTKQRALFVLTKMKEQRTSLIPGRECMSEEESDKLYKELVEPALLELQKDIKS